MVGVCACARACECMYTGEQTHHEPMVVGAVAAHVVARVRGAAMRARKESSQVESSRVKSSQVKSSRGVSQGPVEMRAAVRAHPCARGAWSVDAAASGRLDQLLAYTLQSQRPESQMQGSSTFSALQTRCALQTRVLYSPLPALAQCGACSPARTPTPLAL